MKGLYQIFDTFFTFLAVKFLWKRRKFVLRAIQDFQATETDGVWHLLRGLEKEKDPQIRAELFSHLIEEQSHADLFAIAYKAEANHAFQIKNIERFDLNSESEPSWKNLAYVHVGEIEAVNRFSKIIKFLHEGTLKNTLQTIIEDEEGHVDLTISNVEKINANKVLIEEEIKNVKAKRLQDAFLITSGRLIDVLLETVLSIFYFIIIGPCLYMFSRKRINEKKIEFDNNNIKDVVL